MNNYRPPPIRFNLAANCTDVNVNNPQFSEELVLCRPKKRTSKFRMAESSSTTRIFWKIIIRIVGSSCVQACWVCGQWSKKQLTTDH
ncbi:MAG TPA: hypothetical protein V6D48_13520 [Oculatellaceae cyanobacterium]